MRLFVAIPLSAKLKDKLKNLQKPVEGIRWQSRMQMHLTLRFLGETSRETVEELKEQFRQNASSIFSLKVSGLGTFPNRGAARVLWAGVEKVPALFELQSNIEDICRNTGFKPERRKFIPHITIGKVKNSSPKKVEEWIGEHQSWGEENLFIKKFALYESHQRPGKVTHEIVEIFQLID